MPPTAGVAIVAIHAMAHRNVAMRAIAVRITIHAIAIGIAIGAIAIGTAIRGMAHRRQPAYGGGSGSSANGWSTVVLAIPG